jgi:hypothetical protein
MLLECENCGAPLDVKERESIVRCNYCRIKNRVGHARTLAPVTPPGWTPPVAWVHASAAGAAMPYRKRSIWDGRLAAMVVGILMVFATPLPFMLPRLLGDWERKQASGAERSRTRERHRAWDGRSTITCLEPVTTIRGATVDFGDHPIARVDGCDLRIVASKLSGRRGILSTASPGKLEIVDSEIVADDDAIAGFSSVALEETRIVSRRNGVKMHRHGSFEIEGGSISAQGPAIAGELGSFSCSDAHIVGAISASLLSGGALDLSHCARPRTVPSADRAIVILLGRRR